MEKSNFIEKLFHLLSFRNYSIYPAEKVDVFLLEEYFQFAFYIREAEKKKKEKK